ncbi:SDR family oxidoreductase [Beijerinckia sp. L45]|uniref:SDR family oxidoreductase n=1 Tax=Beijerinckia sp. L45 TaxID=1641855 RepID=UPI00131C6E96|nr:SDR family oxidoreductase [Beijerinckia sp. L45]
MPKTVLLTGTSSGIGEAAAKTFIANGWNVVATARDPSIVLRGIESPRLLSARLDLTDISSSTAAFEASASRFGTIDVVINNAGIGLGGPLEGVSLERLREHLEVNVIGVAAVCQAATAHMRSRGRGLIVNVTSLAGRVGIPFLAPYCAGKFAIEGLTEALHYELRPFGIRVKLIEPGGARTRFVHPWADHPAYEPAADNVRSMMVRGAEKAASPDRVAAVILAAAKDPSDRLRYVATDAVLALRVRQLLPERLWRKVLSKGFGLGAQG